MQPMDRATLELARNWALISILRAGNGLMGWGC